MSTQSSNSSVKAKVQKFGSFLSSMVMPNIAAFIAWGVITTLFIPTGWTPNEQLAKLVGPMITYLLPLLIGYTGGYLVYGQRGGVVGAIATMGAIVGTENPMFIGGMLLGPLGGWTVKKNDDLFKDHIPAGFEMLFNNFSAGLIGFALSLAAFVVIGPIVASLTDLVGSGVQSIINAGLLPLTHIFIEPAKVLFLNNAINHGILTPLGLDQVAETGKSILYLLETNPGPGLGVLVAFAVFGKGAARGSAPGAIIIHFFGGIHEIYFPYVMMKPALFLAVIAGGITGTFVFQLLNVGLVSVASPGSIIALTGVAYRGDVFGIWAGVMAAAVVSFIISAIILKADKSQEVDTFAETVAATKAAKAESKGQVAEVATANEASGEVDYARVQNIIFACDAGMGSSAMGASLLRNKVKKAQLDIDVTNSAISKLTDNANTLIITQEELTERARLKAPSAVHISVENFLEAKPYDQIVDELSKR